MQTMAFHKNTKVIYFIALFVVLLLPFMYGCDEDNNTFDPELRCAEPPPAVPAGICGDVNNLDFTFPADIADINSAELQKQYDCLSWLTFIALNWPAERGCRGVPDTDAQFTKSRVPRVWETYKELYEVFQRQNPFWDPSNQRWHDSPQAVECSNVANGRKILRHTTKAPPIGQNVEDEFLQALATGFGKLTDQAGNLVRYEVRINRDLYEFIIENGYAITGNYSYNGPINTQNLFLPDNTTGFTGQGTMEIKAAWRILTEQDDHSRYYTSDAVIFEPDSGSCTEATMGLIGLHIVHKNFNAPQWVWSTFEHIDNVPSFESNGDGRGYNLFSESCAEVEPDNCWSFQQPIASEEFRCCSNLELNPRVFPLPIDGMPGTPNQATRLNPLRDSGLNDKFQEILAEAGSPFQYYVLVGTEHPVGGRDPENQSNVRKRPCNPIGAARVPPVSENCYTQIPGDLRNTTMETYMASFGSGTQQFSSDSCMNCHGATAADFSFIWLDAMTNIVPIKQD